MKNVTHISWQPSQADFIIFKDREFETDRFKTVVSMSNACMNPPTLKTHKFVYIINLQDIKAANIPKYECNTGTGHMIQQQLQNHSNKVLENSSPVP
jgi:hypothetical protein